MRIALLLALCLIAVFATLVAPRGLAAPAQQLSVADAQADLNAGDYPGCLRKISTLLASSSMKSDSPERYDLLMLRGECMLNLKQPIAAASAFEAASVVGKNQTDLPKIASAEANSVLIKAARGMQYKPKSASPGDPGIDIVAHEPRKQAMKALFDDRRAELAPSIAAALKNSTLVPLPKLLPAAWDLFVLEFGATGDTVQTTEDLKKLGGHARGLIGTELGRLTSRLEQLNNLANEPTLSGGNFNNASISYRGLNTTERDELSEMAKYLVNIEGVAEKGRRINRMLGGTGDTWDAILADCAEARDVAQQAYDRRY
jgi:hypothetical protein